MFPPIGPRLNACVRFWPNTACGSFSEPQGIDFFPEKNKRKKEEEKVGVDQRETGFLKVFATYACAHSCSKINSETQTTPNAKFFFFFFFFASRVVNVFPGAAGSHAPVHLESMFSFSVSAPMSNQQGQARGKPAEKGGSEGYDGILGTDQGLVRRHLVA